MIIFTGAIINVSSTVALIAVSFSYHCDYINRRGRYAPGN